MNTEVTFKAISIIKLKLGSTGKPALKDNTVQLELSANLDRNGYFLPAGPPNGAGVKALTNALIYGINSNIQYAHGAKIWDSADHLRWVIAELDRAFVEVTKINVESGITSSDIAASGN